MKYVNLGRTGVKVSDFCLGCMTFGWGADGGGCDEETARLIIDRALEAGVNFLDTANVYGNGLSEEIVGRALKGRRQSVVLATKFHGAMSQDPNDRGGSRKNIMRAVEESLRRLQTDYIDLYQAHGMDPSTPLEETLSALADLVRQGKVRYIGCSNYAAWFLTKALWTSDRHGYPRMESVQPVYNILARNIEGELLPLCADQKIGVIVYNPLAGGFLSGKYRASEPPPPNTRMSERELYKQRYWHSQNFQAVERLGEIAGRHGTSLPRLSLGWVRANPRVTSVIVGARTLAQLEENLGAWETDLSPEGIEACNEVWDSVKSVAPVYFR
ncbi:MAG: aldo/keto reductase [Chloroflexi bacterium]|nr:aldo/keto reductase [Chloroflexota bacterium]